MVDQLKEIVNKIRKFIEKKLLRIIFYRGYMSLEELSKYKKYELEGESEFTIEPEDKSNVPSYFQNFSGKYQPQKRNVYEIKGGFLCGSEAVPFTEEGYPVLLEDNKNSRDLTINTNCKNGLRDHIRLAKGCAGCIGRNSVVFPLVSKWNLNYFHWVTEYTPMIRALKSYNSKNAKAKILISEDAPRWQTQWIHMLGYQKEDFVYYDGSFVGTKKIVMTEHRRHTGGRFEAFSLSFDDLLWVRKRALSNVKNCSNGEKNIFISRQKSRRSISNFNDIKKVLNEYNFKILHMEDLDVVDQIDAVSNADFIVGVHGSGLVNILFCNPNSNVIELLPRAYNNTHYYRISQMFDMQYENIYPESEMGGLSFNAEVLKNKIESKLNL